jgi:hypothetical protein
MAGRPAGRLSANQTAAAQTKYIMLMLHARAAKQKATVDASTHVYRVAHAATVKARNRRIYAETRSVNDAFVD